MEAAKIFHKRSLDFWLPALGLVGWVAFFHDSIWLRYWFSRPFDLQTVNVPTLFVVLAFFLLLRIFWVHAVSYLFEVQSQGYRFFFRGFSFAFESRFLQPQDSSPTFALTGLVFDPWLLLSLKTYLIRRGSSLNVVEMAQGCILLKFLVFQSVVRLIPLFKLEGYQFVSKFFLGGNDLETLGARSLIRAFRWRSFSDRLSLLLAAFFSLRVIAVVTAVATSVLWIWRQDTLSDYWKTFAIFLMLGFFTRTVFRLVQRLRGNELIDLGAGSAADFQSVVLPVQSRYPRWECGFVDKKGLLRARNLEQIHFSQIPVRENECVEGYVVQYRVRDDNVDFCLRGQESYSFERFDRLISPARPSEIYPLVPACLVKLNGREISLYCDEAARHTLRLEAENLSLQPSVFSQADWQKLMDAVPRSHHFVAAKLRAVPVSLLRDLSALPLLKARFGARLLKKHRVFFRSLGLLNAQNKLRIPYPQLLIPYFFDGQLIGVKSRILAKTPVLSAFDGNLNPWIDQKYLWYFHSPTAQITTELWQKIFQHYGETPATQLHLFEGEFKALAATRLGFSPALSSSGFGYRQLQALVESARQRHPLLKKVTVHIDAAKGFRLRSRSDGLSDEEFRALQLAELFAQSELEVMLSPPVLDKEGLPLDPDEVLNSKKESQDWIQSKKEIAYAEFLRDRGLPRDFVVQALKRSALFFDLREGRRPITDPIDRF